MTALYTVAFSTSSTPSRSRARDFSRSNKAVFAWLLPGNGRPGCRRLDRGHEQDVPQR